MYEVKVYSFGRLLQSKGQVVAVQNRFMEAVRTAKWFNRFGGHCTVQRVGNGFNFLISGNE